MSFRRRRRRKTRTRKRNEPPPSPVPAQQPVSRVLEHVPEGKEEWRDSVEVAVRELVPVALLNVAKEAAFPDVAVSSVGRIRGGSGVVQISSSTEDNLAAFYAAYVQSESNTNYVELQDDMPRVTRTRRGAHAPFAFRIKYSGLLKTFVSQVDRTSKGWSDVRSTRFVIPGAEAERRQSNAVLVSLETSDEKTVGMASNEITKRAEIEVARAAVFEHDERLPKDDRIVAQLKASNPETKVANPAPTKGSELFGRSAPANVPVLTSDGAVAAIKTPGTLYGVDSGRLLRLEQEHFDSKRRDVVKFVSGGPDRPRQLVYAPTDHGAPQATAPRVGLSVVGPRGDAPKLGESPDTHTRYQAVLLKSINVLVENRSTHTDDFVQITGGLQTLKKLLLTMKAVDKTLAREAVVTLLRRDPVEEAESEGEEADAAEVPILLAEAIDLRLDSLYESRFMRTQLKVDYEARTRGVVNRLDSSWANAKKTAISREAALAYAKFTDLYSQLRVKELEIMQIDRKIAALRASYYRSVSMLEASRFAHRLSMAGADPVGPVYTWERRTRLGMDPLKDLPSKIRKDTTVARAAMMLHSAFTAGEEATRSASEALRLVASSVGETAKGLFDSSKKSVRAFFADLDAYYTEDSVFYQQFKAAVIETGDWIMSAAKALIWGVRKLGWDHYLSMAWKFVLRVASDAWALPPMVARSSVRFSKDFLVRLASYSSNASHTTRLAPRKTHEDSIYASDFSMVRRYLSGKNDFVRLSMEEAVRHKVVLMEKYSGEVEAATRAQEGVVRGIAQTHVRSERSVLRDLFVAEIRRSLGMLGGEERGAEGDEEEGDEDEEEGEVADEPLLVNVHDARRYMASFSKVYWRAPWVHWTYQVVRELRSENTPLITKEFPFDDAQTDMIYETLVNRGVSRGVPKEVRYPEAAFESGKDGEEVRIVNWFFEYLQALSEKPARSKGPNAKVFRADSFAKWMSTILSCNVLLRNMFLPSVRRDILASKRKRFEQMRRFYLLRIMRNNIAPAYAGIFESFGYVLAHLAEEVARNNMRRTRFIYDPSADQQVQFGLRGKGKDFAESHNARTFYEIDGTEAKERIRAVLSAMQILVKALVVATHRSCEIFGDVFSGVVRKVWRDAVNPKARMQFDKFMLGTETVAEMFEASMRAVSEPRKERVDVTEVEFPSEIFTSNANITVFERAKVALQEIRSLRVWEFVVADVSMWEEMASMGAQVAYVNYDASHRATFGASIPSGSARASWGQSSFTREEQEEEGEMQPEEQEEILRSSGLAINRDVTPYTRSGRLLLQLRLVASLLDPAPKSPLEGAGRKARQILSSVSFAVPYTLMPEGEYRRYLKTLGRKMHRTLEDAVRAAGKFVKFASQDTSGYREAIETMQSKFGRLENIEQRMAKLHAVARNTPLQAFSSLSLFFNAILYVARTSEDWFATMPFLARALPRYRLAIPTFRMKDRLYVGEDSVVFEEMIAGSAAKIYGRDQGLASDYAEELRSFVHSILTMYKTSRHPEYVIVHVIGLAYFILLHIRQSAFKDPRRHVRGGVIRHRHGRVSQGAVSRMAGGATGMGVVMEYYSFGGRLRRLAEAEMDTEGLYKEEDGVPVIQTLGTGVKRILNYFVELYVNGTEEGKLTEAESGPFASVRHDPHVRLLMHLYLSTRN